MTWICSKGSNTALNIHHKIDDTSEFKIFFTKASRTPRAFETVPNVLSYHCSICGTCRDILEINPESGRDTVGLASTAIFILNTTEPWGALWTESDVFLVQANQIARKLGSWDTRDGNVRAPRGHAGTKGWKTQPTTHTRQRTLSLIEEHDLRVEQLPLWHCLMSHLLPAQQCCFCCMRYHFQGLFEPEFPIKFEDRT